MIFFFNQAVQAADHNIIQIEIWNFFLNLLHLNLVYPLTMHFRKIDEDILCRLQWVYDRPKHNRLQNWALLMKGLCKL